MQEEQAQGQKLQIDDCWNRIGVWRRHEERCPKLAKVIHCRNCPDYSAAGRQMLSRKASEEYLRECTKNLAEDNNKEHIDTQSAFVFRSGGEWLALSSILIREVVDMNAIHSLPHMTNHILRGVVNIRGKLEICVSIGGVLGIERAEKRTAQTGYLVPERLVVAIQDNTVITFPVSEVLGVVRYQPEMLKDLPVTVSGAKAYYTKGILCLDDRDVGFLKDKPLFRTLTRDLS